VIREPLDPAADKPTRWRIVILALCVAAAFTFLAPAEWPDGAGRLQLHWQGKPVLDAEVTLGEPARFESGGIVVELRGTTARIRPPGGDPGLSAARLTLVLPDGRRELIPVLRWDSEHGELVAVRRPPKRAPLALGLLALVIVLWVTEAVPLFVTSLLVPLVLVTAGAQGAEDALAPFFHPIIALFFGGFLMAEAMRRVKLDQLAAISIVARAGRSPATLFFALLGVAAVLSMFMSNTAATAVLVPIALAVTKPLGHAGYRKATVLGIAYAATIGGVGSAIGTPANPLAIEFLETYVGRRISFVGWFAYGLPMVVLFLPVMAMYLWRRSNVKLEPGAFEAARRVARARLEDAGRPDRDQLVVLAVFAGVMALWLTQTVHGLDTGIIAVGGAVALALLGKLRPPDLARISWASLITFGGGLALGRFLVESGMSDWLATRLGLLAGLPSWIGVTAVALLSLLLTTVASNTAAAAMLVPLAIPLAGVLGVDPTLLVCIVAIASSIDFALVIGTPPTMIAYATKLFSTREIFRTGFVLDLIGVTVLVTAVAGLWRVFGLV